MNSTENLRQRKKRTGKNSSFAAVSVIRKCKSVDSILRDDTNECTHRTKFIRSALADDLSSIINGGAEGNETNCQSSAFLRKKCKTTDRILRNEEFGCTVGSKFIRWSGIRSIFVRNPCHSGKSERLRIILRSEDMPWTLHGIYLVRWTMKHMTEAA